MSSWHVDGLVNKTLVDRCHQIGQSNLHFSGSSLCNQSGSFEECQALGSYTSRREAGDGVEPVVAKFGIVIFAEAITSSRDIDRGVGQIFRCHEDRYSPAFMVACLSLGTPKVRKVRSQPAKNAPSWKAQRMTSLLTRCSVRDEGKT